MKLGIRRGLKGFGDIAQLPAEPYRCSQKLIFGVVATAQYAGVAKALSNKELA